MHFLMIYGFASTYYITPWLAVLSKCLFLYRLSQLKENRGEQCLFKHGHPQIHTKQLLVI